MSEVSNKRFVHFSGTREEFESTDYPSTYNDSIVFINEDGGHDVNKTIYTHGKYYGQGVIVRDNDSEANSAVIADSSSKAIGGFSTAFGHNCVASGDLSHAEGCSTMAYGNYSRAGGYYTRAYGNYSMSAGFRSIAEGESSMSFGYYTKTNNCGEFACGRHNYSSENTIFTVGIGDSTYLKNAFAIHSDGLTEQRIDGVLSVISIASITDIDNATKIITDSSNNESTDSSTY